jgi:flagellar motor switch protein FliN
MTTTATGTDPDQHVEGFAVDLGSLRDEYASALGGAGARAQVGGLAPDRGDLAQNLTAVLQIPVAVKAVLGSTTVPIATLMKMRRGTVLSLDRRVGEPIELVVNGRVVARGEVVVLEEGVPHLGISLTEVVGRYASSAEDTGVVGPPPLIR